MIKKIYLEPSMNVSLFETENVITASGYDTAENAIKGGAFTIDGGKSSKEVKAIFAF